MLRPLQPEINISWGGGYARPRGGAVSSGPRSGEKLLSASNLRAAVTLPYISVVLLLPRRNDFVSEFGRRAVTECGSRCGYRLFSSLRISPLSSAICVATPNLSDRDRRRRPQTFAPQVDRLKLTLPILIVLFRDERIMKRIPVIIF